MHNAVPADAVAIIGMAGRFPGAPDVDTFWSNLLAGVDSISHFEEPELEPSRLEPSGTRGRPDYARARGVLADADLFDAAFFSITPREAAVIDPQHRLLLETAWAALESAGCDPASCAGRIGVWAGAGEATYYEENVLPRLDVVAQIGFLQATMGSGKDYLTTRASYKLNLRGPSVNVYAGESTSLVAVCEAFGALLGRQCEIALAGGVSLAVPQRLGYVNPEGPGGGQCRPFDARATGPVPGHGVGLVVLKRLEDALADGDFVYAVIRGAALNGGGTADGPAAGIDAQAEVVAMAQAVADVTPETITYVEAHGTAARGRDEAELAALKRVFAGASARSCVLGSVKGNVGHLGAAAGVAGLIKAALALRHRKIPPTVGFETPNRELSLEGCPFFVNPGPYRWPDAGVPRRAGVSAFGSTNAHVVLEEAPEPERPAPSWPEQLLVVSARTAAGLDAATAGLARQLGAEPDRSLADVACTLQAGRHPFPFRRALACTSLADGVQGLTATDSGRLVSGHRDKADAKLAFLFPGQGAQAVGMAGELYARQPVFAAELDACAELLEPLLDVDIRSLVYPQAQLREKAERRLAETSITQPVLFAIELALARLWMSWGVEPAAMLGHSLGEYVAACLAGVLPRDQAAAIVATRGRLMQAQPRGAMMAVRLSAAELAPLLGSEVVIAGYNAPVLQVVSGPAPAIEELQRVLSGRSVGCKVLATSHAFHSPMMDGALAPFREAMRAASLQPPTRPWISCVTGDWISAGQAVDPEYWVSQLRCPVRFSDGIRRLSEEPPATLLEVGPGQTLTALVRLHRDRPPRQVIAATLGKEPGDDGRLMLEALGRLWVSGTSVDWPAVHGGARRTRLPLPTYPFERKRHWIEPDPQAPAAASAGAAETASGAAPAGDAGPVRPAPEDQRPPSLMRRLVTVLERISGIEFPADFDGKLSFFEMGLDSLFLIQLAFTVSDEFGVRVSMRELLDDYPNLQALEAHLLARRPELLAESAAAAAGAVPERRPSGPTPGPVAGPAARLREAGDVPLYFGPRSELFGLCRVPDASHAEPRKGVLFCAPIGQEYIRSHQAFRMLSNFLLQRGIPVLKFDWFGTGDSLGDITDADVERWVEDVSTAAAQLQALAGVGTASIVALRYGAVIAARAVEKGLQVEDLVLWDPVVSGSAYLEEITRVQADLVAHWTGLYPFPTVELFDLDPEEILGFRFGWKLRSQIAASGLLECALGGCARVHVVTSEERDEYRALCQGLSRRRAGLSSTVIADDGAWDRHADFERALLPSRILDAIVKVVSGEDRQ